VGFLDQAEGREKEKGKKENRKKNMTKGGNGRG
jgi:hypothetical protein